MIQGIQYGFKSPILASKETRKRVKKSVPQEFSRKKNKDYHASICTKKHYYYYYILLLINYYYYKKKIIICGLLKILKREKKWLQPPIIICSILLQLFYAECQKVCFFLLFVCASVHIEINYRLLEFWRIIFSSNRNIVNNCLDDKYLKSVWTSGCNFTDCKFWNSVEKYYILDVVS